MGKKFADRRETGAAMGASNNFVGVESVLDGPATPDARDCGRGIDEDSVHIEEKSGAVDGGHRGRKLVLAGSDCNPENRRALASNVIGAGVV
jgi:hypothetical protein